MLEVVLINRCAFVSSAVGSVKYSCVIKKFSGNLKIVSYLIFEKIL